MRILTTTFAGLFALTLASFAQAAPSSGMLLGVYAFSNYHGLRVTGTIHGYSAQGRLFAGDVLKRVTADGINVYPTRSHGQIEFAKDQIGPFQPAALEIFRPGVGTMYLWVEFQPVGGAVAYSVSGAPQSQPQQFKAKIFTEKEKPGAAKLFKQKIQPLPTPLPQPQPKPFPQPFPKSLPKPQNGNGSAASLFGN